MDRSGSFYLITGGVFKLHRSIKVVGSEPMPNITEVKGAVGKEGWLVDGIKWMLGGGEGKV